MNKPIELVTEEQKSHDMKMVVLLMLSLFGYSYVFFTDPFEFYFAYFIYLFLLPKYMFEYGFNRQMFYIFLILFLTGVFNIFMGHDTPQQFIKIFTGLSLSYFFYYYIMHVFEFDVESMFKWYMNGCFIVSLIGIFQFYSFQIGFTPGYNFNWIFNKWSLNVVARSTTGFRINSIFPEPTHLGAFLSAAFFVSLYNLFNTPFAISRTKGIVIIVCYALSFSGLAQTGILLSILFLAISYGLIRYIIIFLPIGVLIFNFLLENSIEFRERFDSLIYLFNGGKFILGKTHGSSFILYNNFHVAMENFSTNYLFGTGLGSHPVAFEKYSLGIDIKTYGFNLNSADANSMLLRLISETGIFGVGIFLYIIFKFYVKRDREHHSFHWLVSNSILVMILLNLFRQGHYFFNGFPFFIMLYCYNYFSYEEYREKLPEKGGDVIDQDPSSVSLSSPSY